MANSNGAGQQLTSEVADQGHRGVLADIDGDRDQLGRVNTTRGPNQPLGLGPVHVHHDDTTSGVDEEPASSFVAPPEVV
jgi:hypothetical protein